MGLLSELDHFGYDDYLLCNILFKLTQTSIATYPVPITKCTTSILDEAITQLKSAELRLRTQYPSLAINVSYYAEPFVNANAHSLGGAYPHDPARPTTPSLCLLGYSIDTSLSSGTYTFMVFDILKPKTDFYGRRESPSSGRLCG